MLNNPIGLLDNDTCDLGGVRKFLSDTSETAVAQLSLQ